MQVRIYDVTVIASNLQRWELIEVSDSSSEDGKLEIALRTLKTDRRNLDSLASQAHTAFAATGLEDSAYAHSSNKSPRTLRLVYDCFPLGEGMPIMAVYPIKGEPLFFGEYNIREARMQPERMLFAPEGVYIRFANLHVELYYQNMEDRMESRHGRKLRKSGVIIGGLPILKRD